MIYTPSGTFRTMEMTAAQAQALIDIEPVLQELSLHIVCPRCVAAGRTRDAFVGGNNAPGDSTWNINCACTSRTHRRGTGH